MIEYFAHQTTFFLAHEGHGSTPIGGGNGLLHYLLEPLHAPFWVGAIIVGYVAWKAIQALSLRMNRRPSPIDQDNN